MDFIFPEFRDQFATTRYPFADEASLLPQIGPAIPIDLFLDAALYPVGNSGGLYLAGIEISGNTARLTIRGNSRDTVVTGTIPLSDPDEIVVLSDAYGRPAGTLIVDTERALDLAGWAPGLYVFTTGAAQFAASCVTPSPDAGVQGILLPSGTILTGDVWLVGGDGVVLRESEGAIRVDVVGDPLFRRKLCGEAFITPRFVKTINGQAPDSYGNFQFAVSDNEHAHPNLRIIKTDRGLKLSAVGR